MWMAICPMRVRHFVFDIALRCDHPRDLDIPPGTKPPNPEESEKEMMTKRRRRREWQPRSMRMSLRE